MATHSLDTTSECLALRVAAGTLLRCEAGLPWLVFAPDRPRSAGHDRLLAAGEECVFAESGTVYLSCLRLRDQPARVRVRPAVAKEGTRLGELLRHWLRGMRMGPGSPPG